MPSDQRTHQVGGAEEVEAAGEEGGGDAVEGGAVPGYLGAVDCEVRGDGAETALGGEDGVGVGGSGGGGLGGGGGGGLVGCGAGRGISGGVDGWGWVGRVRLGNLGGWRRHRGFEEWLTGLGDGKGLLQWMLGGGIERGRIV